MGCQVFALQVFYTTANTKVVILDADDGSTDGSRSIHKRIFPPVCKLGRRTVGIDWRETTGVRR